MGFYSAFAEYYETVFPFRDEVYAFLKGCLPAGARRILDAGCGTGHYCGRFAADGFEAVGLDLDPRMIEVARGQYPTATFHCMNMLEVETLSPPFDLIFCIGNSAPHLTQDEFARFLDQVRGNLRPRGAWVFQTVNWDYVLTQESYPFRPRKLGQGDTVFHREYRNVSESRIRFLTRLVAGDRTIFEGDVWLYPMRTEAYMQLHLAAGFEPIGHFADYQHTPFDSAKDSASVFVFRKPAPGTLPGTS